MTSTTYAPASPAAHRAQVQTMLDNAANKFTRPVQITFVVVRVRDTLSFRVFTVDEHGVIHCLDQWMRSIRTHVRYTDGRGFHMPERSANPEIANQIYQTLRTCYGDDYAANAQIREVS